MNIPPGYSISIHTSENDYDNLSTKVLYGLKEGDVKFYISILNYFKTSYFGGNDETHFGNGVVGKCDITIAVKDSYNKYPPDSKQLLDDLKEYGYDKGFCSDLVGNVIQTWCDGKLWRVFEEVEVYYIPIEIENVTENFNLN